MFCHLGAHGMESFSSASGGPVYAGTFGNTLSPALLALHRNSAELLQPLLVAHRPWSDVSLDFVTGLPLSEGNTTILKGVDRFSKVARFIPLPKLPSAKQTAEVMLHNVFRIHGFPRNILSDRGSMFVGRFWTAFCNLIVASVSLTFWSPP